MLYRLNLQNFIANNLKNIGDAIHLQTAPNLKKHLAHPHTTLTRDLSTSPTPLLRGHQPSKKMVASRTKNKQRNGLLSYDAPPERTLQTSDENRRTHLQQSAERAQQREGNAQQNQDQNQLKGEKRATLQPRPREGARIEVIGFWEERPAVGHSPQAPQKRRQLPHNASVALAKNRQHILLKPGSQNRLQHAIRLPFATAAHNPNPPRPQFHHLPQLHNILPQGCSLQRQHHQRKKLGNANRLQYLSLVLRLQIIHLP
jgi:hypothetical protein